jgi:ABC-type uncharacterized transport system permease subunit
MTIILIAIVCYLLGTALLARGLGSDQRRISLAIWALPGLGIALHIGAHLWAWRIAGGANLHVISALSIVGLGMAMMTWAVGVRGRMAALGVIVFPTAALTALAYGMLGRDEPSTLDWRLQLHAWSALLAYATLAMAAVLAVFLWLQERALRQRRFIDWLRALPPLIELEMLLFRTIAAGFVLLTAALLSGVLFVEDLLAQHLAHKTVFSVLSWLSFGALLIGRRLRGWRGTTAVRWTLLAMVFLVLAFFGSNVVLELILKRR